MTLLPTDLLDWSHVRRVLDANPPLDGYAAYYRQYDVPHRRLGPLVPSTRDLLRAAFRPEMRVLDVGCGRGDTLLDAAPLFRQGVGVDDSADVMVATADAERQRRGVLNVRFRTARAAELPFAAGTFDFVFSERGPLATSDVTLAEAVRVLRPGGLLFVETIGDWNSWETRAAFEPGYVRPPSPLGVLEVERARFDRHGVAVTTLASRLETLAFATFDDWLTYQLYTWSPPGRAAFAEANMAAVRRFRAAASTPAGEVRVTVHTVWLAGTKAGSAGMLR